MAVSKKMAVAASTNPATILTLAGPPKLNPASEGTKIAAPVAPKASGSAFTETISGRDSRDSYAVTALTDIVDRSLHSTAARFTMGLSPAALAESYLDWATHLAFSPGKRLQLVDKAARKTVRFANYAFRCASESGKANCCIEPLPHDRRFVGEDWKRWPYNFMYQAFLLNQQWWHNATTCIRGVTKQHENMVQFVSRQILDMFSPRISC
jgi:polyhydroxyalkanoate synthase